MAEINIRTEELLPARDASRGLGKAIDQLVSGTTEKYLIVNRNQVQAVLISVDRYAELASGIDADSPHGRRAAQASGAPVSTTRTVAPEGRATP